MPVDSFCVCRPLPQLQSQSSLSLLLPPPSIGSDRCRSSLLHSKCASGAVPLRALPTQRAPLLCTVDQSNSNRIEWNRREKAATVEAARLPFPGWATVPPPLADSWRTVGTLPAKTSALRSVFQAAWRSAWSTCAAAAPPACRHSSGQEAQCVHFEMKDAACELLSVGRNGRMENATLVR